MEVKTYFSKEKIRQIEIEKIETDEFVNINSVSYEKVFKFSEIIKRVGVFTPLLLRPDIKNKNKFFCFSSPEVLSALHFLQVKAVPAVVLYITQPEAALYYLNENKNLNIFERAELIRYLTQPGKYKLAELCDILKISSKAMDKMLLPLVLSQGERDIFLNRGFGNKLLTEYIKIPEDKRKALLNDIIAKDLNETDSVKFIKDYLFPKEKPIKLACLKNDTVIMNSITRLAENLRSCGISAETKKEETAFGYEYKIILHNNPEQICFNFTELMG